MILAGGMKKGCILAMTVSICPETTYLPDQMYVLSLVLYNGPPQGFSVKFAPYGGTIFLFSARDRFLPF